jgi:hypothetical protein
LVGIAKDIVNFVIKSGFERTSIQDVHKEPDESVFETWQTKNNFCYLRSNVGRINMEMNVSRSSSQNGVFENWNWSSLSVNFSFFKEELERAGHASIVEVDSKIKVFFTKEDLLVAMACKSSTHLVDFDINVPSFWMVINNFNFNVFWAELNVLESKIGNVVSTQEVKMEIIEVEVRENLVEVEHDDVFAFANSIFIKTHCKTCLVASLDMAVQLKHAHSHK